MSEAYLSEYEKIYLLHGVQEDLRLDGRSTNDYRPMRVEFNVINNSYGSCQLTLVNNLDSKLISGTNGTRIFNKIKQIIKGKTKVIAAVKAELDTPDVLTPNSGKIDFFVDCSANAAPEFQGRGGDEIASRIVNLLTNLYSSKNFDLTQLCIVSGKKCWHLFIDIVLLESFGNLYDACSLATKFALGKASFPRLVVKSDDEGQIELDFAETNNTLTDNVTLNVEGLPYSISVSKIGNSYVVDADLKEESVTKVRITFGFDASGNIRFTSKDGFGSLDPDSLYSIIDIAKKSSKRLHQFYLKSMADTKAVTESIADL